MPAQAQAQELITLFFEMDDVRQESAQLFAELMVVAKDPGRAQTAETIGSKPSLSPYKELSDQLMENQASLEITMEIINTKKYSDDEVNKRYEDVQSFVTALINFENLAQEELLLAGDDDERFRQLATTLFEGTTWNELLDQDAHLRDTLGSLADLHDLEFASLPYDEIFRERLVELDKPIVSEEVGSITHPFTVSDPVITYVLLNVTFDIPLSDSMDISLEDPNGDMISSSQLALYTDTDNAAELKHESYIYRSGSVIIVKLFPGDPSVPPVPGDWKLHVTAPKGCGLVIGMIQL